jgi:hypothetical protein
MYKDLLFSYSSSDKDKRSFRNNTQEHRIRCLRLLPFFCRDKYSIDQTFALTLNHTHTIPCHRLPRSIARGCISTRQFYTSSAVLAPALTTQSNRPTLPRRTARGNNSNQQLQNHRSTQRSCSWNGSSRLLPILLETNDPCLVYPLLKDSWHGNRGLGLCMATSLTALRLLFPLYLLFTDPGLL